jgi:hypothetical protein
MAKFKVLSWHLPGRTRKTTKNLSGYSVSGPRFEPGTSRIQSRNANHSTTTFGLFCVIEKKKTVLCQGNTEIFC